MRAPASTLLDWCAIDYAKARVKFGHGEIRVLNADGSVKDVIRLDGSTRNYD